MFVVNVSQAQNPSYWFFGQKAGIHFTGTIVTAGIDNAMNTPEGCAVYEDLSSNNVVYSNGDKVWGPNDQVLQNGDNLDGNMNSCQSALFFKPKNKLDFYLFTTDKANGFNGLTYNLIKTNGSTYIVSEKNKTLFPNSSERMTLTNHCDRKSAWLITHAKDNSDFHVFKISEDSLILQPIITSVGTSHSGNYLNAKGCIKATTKGDKIGLTKMGSGEVELFKFDNLSGVVYDPILIQNLPNAYGIEFDPDGNYLYVSTASGFLFQFSIQNWDSQLINNSKTLISSQSQLLGSLQLAPDGKIYVSKDNSIYLGRIENPASMGLGCNYNPTAIYLNGKKSEAGLPQVFTPKSDIDMPGVKVCLGDTAFFKILGDTTFIDSVFWDFGDLQNTSDTSTLFSPYYIYSQKTVFEVTLIVYYCDIADTLINYAETLGPPHPYLGPDTSICDNFGLTLFAGNSTDYLWDDGSTNSTRYVNSPGTYWVVLTNSCGSNSDTMNLLNVFHSPVVQLPNDTNICIGDSILLYAPTTNCVNIWQASDTIDMIVAYQSGTYSLVAIGTNGCSGSDIFSLKVIEPPYINLGPDTTICLGKAIIFNGSAQGFNLWQNGSNAFDISISENENVSLTVSNLCGVTTDSVVVSFVECEQYVYVPNAFTPNGDGLNDIFLPWTDNITDYQLRIYDRWGILVFITNDRNIGWDGNFNGSPSQEDAYVWWVEYSNYAKQKFINKGTVTLYR